MSIRYFSLIEVQKKFSKMVSTINARELKVSMLNLALSNHCRGIF